MTTTTKAAIRISLSELKTKKRAELWEESYPRYRIFSIKYQNLGGLPAYFLDFGDEDDCMSEEGICSNNAADIIQALNERGYEVVLVP